MRSFDVTVMFKILRACVESACHTVRVLDRNDNLTLWFYKLFDNDRFLFVLLICVNLCI